MVAVTSENSSEAGMIHVQSLQVPMLSRARGCLHRNLRLCHLLKNWPEAASVAFERRPVTKLYVRNGVVLSAPSTLSLLFLFDEIWVREFYTPRPYRVQRGDVVIDIGANVGVFALYAATRAADVNVYAYEPFPDSFA